MRIFEFCLIGLTVLLITVSAAAETMYITEVVRITLRTGRGTDHKIIAMVESGQPVELLEQGEEWSRVRLQNGKEGWVLSRFLSSEIPDQLVLERLRRKHETLQAHAEKLAEENERLKTENQSLTADLAQDRKELGRLSTDYETLKQEAENVLKLKRDYEKARLELTHQTERADHAERELSRLTWTNYFYAFLSGGGVLLIGYILGASARRQRRSSSLRL